MKKTIDNTIAAITDGLEKFSGPTDRAGHAIERAYKLDQADVPHDAIASILTASSKRLGKNNEYSESEIPTMVKLYDDCLSGTPISDKTTRAVLRDQEEAHGFDGNPMPA
ncbi:hypothetical protein KUA23_13840 [Pseudomonas pergaminensis]|uniref:Uncharacterized protein n=1 Tax=Pseudomonas pergaminensis TaxID=2853159 RepID=A0ABD7TQL4_9PSED|nr:MULTISPECIES: hypothetical protein [Pseudomonas]NWC59489.1 hypothetical protein [Pseudomonas veronii]OPB02748.1 hypothetical protein BFW91_26295 [Pseudomonas fluorescens]USW03705.1 hypothetical protein KUA23_13840 [Pseudomonas pergaminensis]